jgi:hypothetical protein
MQKKGNVDRAKLYLTLQNKIKSYGMFLPACLPALVRVLLSAGTAEQLCELSVTSELNQNCAV